MVTVSFDPTLIPKPAQEEKPRAGPASQGLPRRRLRPGPQGSQVPGRPEGRRGEGEARPGRLREEAGRRPEEGQGPGRRFGPWYYVTPGESFTQINLDSPPCSGPRAPAGARPGRRLPGAADSRAAASRAADCRRAIPDPGPRPGEADLNPGEPRIHESHEKSRRRKSGRSSIRADRRGRVPLPNFSFRAIRVFVVLRRILIPTAAGGAADGGADRFGAAAACALGAGAEPAGRAGARLGHVRLAGLQHRQPGRRRDRGREPLADHRRRHGGRPASGAGPQAAREDRHGREGPRHLERGLRRARPDADQGQRAGAGRGRDPGPGPDLPGPDRGRQPRTADDRDLGPGEEDRGVHRAGAAIRHPRGGAHRADRPGPRRPPARRRDATSRTTRARRPSAEVQGHSEL